MPSARSTCSHPRMSGWWARFPASRIGSRISNASSPTARTAWIARSSSCASRQIEEHIMGPSTVFLIPILGICVGMVAVIGGVIVKPWLAHREKRMELEAKMIAEKAAQYAAHTSSLEQRVRVLERIVTDRGIDVADEIEKLRDQPPLN